jgi:hypothetical protein
MFFKSLKLYICLGVSVSYSMSCMTKMYSWLGLQGDCFEKLNSLGSSFWLELDLTVSYAHTAGQFQHDANGTSTLFPMLKLKFPWRLEPHFWGCHFQLTNTQKESLWFDLYSSFQCELYRSVRRSCYFTLTNLVVSTGYKFDLRSYESVTRIQNSIQSLQKLITCRIYSWINLICNLTIWLLREIMRSKI